MKSPASRIGELERSLHVKPLREEDERIVFAAVHSDQKVTYVEMSAWEAEKRRLDGLKLPGEIWVNARQEDKGLYDLDWIVFSLGGPYGLGGHCKWLTKAAPPLSMNKERLHNLLIKTTIDATEYENAGQLSDEEIIKKCSGWLQDNTGITPDEEMQQGLVEALQRIKNHRHSASCPA